jgi:N-formylglutamate deformylase
VHALQIEIARRLYMDEARLQRAPGMARLQRNLEHLLTVLAGSDWSFLAR